MTALLALTASVLWGTSDFFGGTATKRLPSFDVVAISQAVALAVLVVVAAAAGLRVTPAGVLWSVGAGIVGMIALGAFYRALAEGTMGVVAPIAATGVAIPVAVGMLTGDHPSRLQLVGIACAVVGVVAAGGPDVRSDVPHARRQLLLALVAAAGFGAVMLFIAEGSRTSVVTTLLLMRATSVVLLAGAALALRRRPAVGAPDLPALAVVGGLDLAANAAYAAATRTGVLTLAAVLASLYPVVTVLLARQVHAERLTPTQTFGAVAAISGGALIALAGSVG